MGFQKVGRLIGISWISGISRISGVGGIRTIAGMRRISEMRREMYIISHGKGLFPRYNNKCQYTLYTISPSIHINNTLSILRIISLFKQRIHIARTPTQKKKAIYIYIKSQIKKLGKRTIQHAIFTPKKPDDHPSIKN